MSAATSPALEQSLRRRFARYPAKVALDVLVLRSGVPENLPGRCTDLSETGVGGMIAGELSPGQQVALELRLPNVGVPVRARAMVRYQGRLRCGFEFVSLSVEQREMIRYWAFRGASPQHEAPGAKVQPQNDAATPGLAVLHQSVPQIRVRKRRFNLLLFAMLLLAILGWWQWQRSWRELEVGTASSEEAPLRVTPETMEMRIVSKVDPVYPEDARRAGKQGVAVLDAVIAADGTVKRVQTVSGDDLLAKSATDAVRSWKFEPYLASGRAVAVETTIAIEFKL